MFTFTIAGVINLIFYYCWDGTLKGLLLYLSKYTKHKMYLFGYLYQDLLCIAPLKIHFKGNVTVPLNIHCRSMGYNYSMATYTLQNSGSDNPI